MPDSLHYWSFYWFSWGKRSQYHACRVLLSLCKFKGLLQTFFTATCFPESKKKKSTTLTPNFSVHCASVLSLNHSTFRLERILPFDSLTVVDATRHLRPAMPWVEVRLTADILPSSLRGLTNISFSGNPERATPKGKMWVSRPPQSNGISWANHGPLRLLFESHLVI